MEADTFTRALHPEGVSSPGALLGVVVLAMLRAVKEGLLLDASLGDRLAVAVRMLVLAEHPSRMPVLVKLLSLIRLPQKLNGPACLQPYMLLTLFVDDKVCKEKAMPCLVAMWAKVFGGKDTQEMVDAVLSSLCAFVSRLPSLAEGSPFTASSRIAKAALDPYVLPSPVPRAGRALLVLDKLRGVVDTEATDRTRLPLATGLFRYVIESQVPAIREMPTAKARVSLPAYLRAEKAVLALADSPPSPVRTAALFTPSPAPQPESKLVLSPLPGKVAGKAGRKRPVAGPSAGKENAGEKVAKRRR